jgi:iron(III) transport system permease protein
VIRSRQIWIGTAAVLFLVPSILPGAYMVGISLFSPEGTPTLANYGRLLSEPRQRELLRTTVALGAVASLISTSIGAPLGFLLARFDLPRVALWRLALLVPLVIPPYVLALVWIFITGYAEFAYSASGAALVLGIAFYPLSMLASEAAFRRVDASLEEAALLLTTPRRAFSRITVPLVAPLIAAAALLVFALAIAEFSVPGLLRVRVYTTEVFTAFAALYDYGRATALAIPVMAVTLIAAMGARWMVGEGLLTSTATWHPAAPLHVPLRKSLALALVIAWLIVVVAVPIAVLATHSQRITSSIVPAWPAIRASIMLSLIGATVIAVVSMVLGYARARLQTSAAFVMDLILIASFAVPSTVVGIGIIGLWNRPAVPIELYSSSITIVMGYIARFLPIGIVIIAAAVRQVPAATEEAAYIAGAGWTRAFWRIVIPQIRGAVGAAWLVVFIFAFGEVGTTVLVAPPGEATLPVRVYTLIANAREGDIAALALLQVFATLVPLSLFALTGGRMERKS